MANMHIPGIHFGISTRQSHHNGTYTYTYDAWNRLLTVTKAFREDSYSSGDVQLGDLTLGSVINTIQYDGLGRRIVKVVKNSAQMDMTLHYYYDGQRVIEERDLNDQIIKQYVWAPSASGYIDELVQIAINGNVIVDEEFDPDHMDHKPNKYYALQDANFNVLGIIAGDAATAPIHGVAGAGALVERYEYTPYGKRQVYTSAGSNDPLCNAPTNGGQRVTPYSGSTQAAYALYNVGHQGLMHDEETGLVYNRARMWNPPLGRFNQGDPIGYPDGMNRYAGYHVMYGGVDPMGLEEYRDWGWNSLDHNQLNRAREHTERHKKISAVANKLKGLCKAPCISKCDKESGCDKQTCRAEAQKIAEKYVDMFYASRGGGIGTPWSDYSCGKLCYEWQDTTMHALSSLGELKCFKYALAGNVSETPGLVDQLADFFDFYGWGGPPTTPEPVVRHNWVNVTVGPKAKKGGKRCTAKLDPWLEGAPNVYNIGDESHPWITNYIGRYNRHGLKIGSYIRTNGKRVGVSIPGGQIAR